jgi:hypothetical protein
MPGFLLHVGAQVTCMHGGQAQPTVPNLRVSVNGQQTVTRTAPYSVAGCAFNVSGAPSPCVTAQWISASLRLTSDGQALLLIDSQANCVPNGTPVLIAGTQTRVTGM